MSAEREYEEKPAPLTHDETKEAAKEAIKEWMDDKFKELGMWSARTLLVLVLGALTYFILITNGWHK